MLELAFQALQQLRQRTLLLVFRIQFEAEIGEEQRIFWQWLSEQCHQLDKRLSGQLDALLLADRANPRAFDADRCRIACSDEHAPQDFLVTARE